MQHIDLGADETSIALPHAVRAQAVRSNCFSIIGAMVNPKKHNLNALTDEMPCFWGLSDEVISQIINTKKF